MTTFGPLLDPFFDHFWTTFGPFLTTFWAILRIWPENQALFEIYEKGRFSNDPKMVQNGPKSTKNDHFLDPFLALLNNHAQNALLSSP
jgi:hypothetical protein